MKCVVAKYMVAKITKLEVACIPEIYTRSFIPFILLSGQVEFKDLSTTFKNREGVKNRLFLYEYYAL